MRSEVWQNFSPLFVWLRQASAVCSNMEKHVSSLIRIPLCHLSSVVRCFKVHERCLQKSDFIFYSQTIFKHLSVFAFYAFYKTLTLKKMDHSTHHMIQRKELVSKPTNAIPFNEMLYAWVEYYFWALEIRLEIKVKRTELSMLMNITQQNHLTERRRSDPKISFTFNHFVLVRSSWFWSLSQEC